MHKCNRNFRNSSAAVKGWKLWIGQTQWHTETHSHALLSIWDFLLDNTKFANMHKAMRRLFFFWKAKQMIHHLCLELTSVPFYHFCYLFIFGEPNSISVDLVPKSLFILLPLSCIFMFLPVFLLTVTTYLSKSAKMATNLLSCLTDLCIVLYSSATFCVLYPLPIVKSLPLAILLKAVMC